MLYESVAEMVIDLLFQNGDRLVRKEWPELKIICMYTTCRILHKTL